MKYVAVHADDFGLSQGTNEAIARLLSKGAIQSATLMANSPAFEDARLRIENAAGEWCIGLHVNLTQGMACGDGAGLESAQNGAGEFLGRRSLWSACRKNHITIGALVRELEAQWARCVNAGVRPTHLDTHQHAHAIPQVQQALWKVANRNRVPVRVLRLNSRLGPIGRRLKTMALNAAARQGERKAGVDVKGRIELVSAFQASGLPTLEGYRSLLKQTKAEYVELMVHPALVDRQHREMTGISEVSGADYDVLASEGWNELLGDPSFRFLPTHQLLEAAGVRAT